MFLALCMCVWQKDEGEEKDEGEQDGEERERNKSFKHWVNLPTPAFNVPDPEVGE